MTNFIKTYKSRCVGTIGEHLVWETLVTLPTTNIFTLETHLLQYEKFEIDGRNLKRGWAQLSRSALTNRVMVLGRKPPPLLTFLRCQVERSVAFIVRSRVVAKCQTCSLQIAVRTRPSSKVHSDGCGGRIYARRGRRRRELQLQRAWLPTSFDCVEGGNENQFLTWHKASTVRLSPHTVPLGWSLIDAVPACWHVFGNCQGISALWKLLFGRLPASWKKSKICPCFNFKK